MDESSCIHKAYSRFPAGIARARSQLGRPLTLTEKILYSHLADNASLPQGGFRRGVDYVDLLPDRVAMQDATAQMALLQLLSTNIPSVKIPTTVHCDHLIEGEKGRHSDVSNALSAHGEVFDFLSSCARRFGIGFWKPDSGIIHQVVLENYAFPGGLLIGTDSHTPNAGGMGMIAVGVGGADAVDAMVGLPWEIRWPKIIGVRLKGTLNGWASPKDVILKLAGILTVAGGTGSVIEYFGPGTAALSATGKATICNMGAEVGATTSLFPYDEASAAYLRATHRPEVAEHAQTLCEHLRPDPEIETEPGRFFDRVIEIDLSTLEPTINGPFTPDRAHALSEFATAVEKNGWPQEVSAALIGSCTNSSYEDLDRVISIARAALEKGVTLKTPLFLNPGSEQIRSTLERDGHLAVFEKLGATVMANACGPCIGQWRRMGASEGKPNSIVTSYNRNFTGRNDGNPQTAAFVTSPETVMAFALAGSLTTNYLRDGFPTSQGGMVRLDPPRGNSLPAQGFVKAGEGFVPPLPNGDPKAGVNIAPHSERLQRLDPFAPPRLPHDLTGLAVLIKVKGKCTTDHISPAGKWLVYRGHLEKISQNLLLTAHNIFTDAANKVWNVHSRSHGTVHDVASEYRQRGTGWVIVADGNYGEGSSREHAAMEPRYLGCKAIIAKSFARIHEGNLKKQGILPFTFSEEQDYGRIREDDRLTFPVEELTPGKPLSLQVRHADGSQESIKLVHTMSETQIQWFKAGSALNLIARS